MKKTTTIFFLFIIQLTIINNQLKAQSPDIDWQKCLGGSSEDVANSIQQTTDGGYIVAGYSSSNDGDVLGNHGGRDYWIVKLDSSGIIQWQKCLGGSDKDVAESIQQTIDGGYIVAGRSSSNNGDVSGNHGGEDYWIVKLNSTGSIQWQKCLGGSDNDYAFSIQQTTEGGYIIAGYPWSNDGDISGNHGVNDYWIVKLDSSGIIQWQKCFGGSAGDAAYSIQQTTNGGYIIAGFTESNDGDVSGNHGVSDYWIVKLDSSGVIQWQRCLGGSASDVAYSIQQTTDGGYIVAGYSWSNDGDISGNHGVNDYWIVKLDSSGYIQWQKCLGGSASDVAFSIQQTTDGGYIVAGYSWSNDGDVSGNHGDYDYWIVKLNSSGSIQWQKCLGGSSYDYAHSIQQTTDGGYIVAGNTGSNDYDVSDNHGDMDYWIVKLNDYTAGIKTNKYEKGFSIYPNPSKGLIYLEIRNIGKETITLEIVNINGQIIYNEIIENNSININKKIDLKNYTNGLYFLKVKSNDFEKVEKFNIE